MLSSTLRFITLIKHTSQGEEKKRNSNVSASTTSTLDFNGNVINALKVQGVYFRNRISIISGYKCLFLVVIVTY